MSKFNYRSRNVASSSKDIILEEMRLFRFETVLTFAK